MYVSIEECNKHYIIYIPSLPSLRKQEIIAGIISSQEVLFVTSFEYLKYTIHQYIISYTNPIYPNHHHPTSTTSNTANSNLIGSKLIQDALLALLGLVASIAAIVKIEDLCTHSLTPISPHCVSTHNFMTYIIEHLLSNR